MFLLSITASLLAVLAKHLSGAGPCPKIVADDLFGSLYTRDYSYTEYWRLVHLGESVSQGQIRIICSNSTRSPETTCIFNEVYSIYEWYPRSTVTFNCCSGIHCSDRHRCVKGRCICKSQYRGDQCLELVPVCNQCHNGGVCVRGNRCRCRDGWKGEQCEEIVKIPNTWAYIEELSYEPLGPAESIISTPQLENWDIYATVDPRDQFRRPILVSQWTRTDISNPEWVSVMAQISVDESAIVSDESKIHMAVFLVQSSIVDRRGDPDAASFSLKSGFDGLGFFVDAYSGLIQVTITGEQVSNGRPGTEVPMERECTHEVDIGNQFELSFALYSGLLRVGFLNNGSNTTLQCLANYDFANSSLLLGRSSWTLGIVSRNSSEARPIQIDKFSVYFGPKQQLSVCRSSVIRSKMPAITSRQQVQRGEYLGIYCPVNFVAVQSDSKAERQKDIKFTRLRCTGLGNGTFAAAVECQPNPVICDPPCSNAGQCQLTGQPFPKVSCTCFSQDLQQPDCSFSSSSLPVEFLVYLPLSLQAFKIDEESPNRFEFINMADQSKFYLKSYVGANMFYDFTKLLVPDLVETTVVKLSELPDSYLEITYRNKAGMISFVVFFRALSHPTSQVPLLTWKDISFEKEIVAVSVDPLGFLTFHLPGGLYLQSRLAINFKKWVLVQLSFDSGYIAVTLPYQNVKEVFQTGPYPELYSRVSSVVIGKPEDGDSPLFSNSSLNTDLPFTLWVACLGILPGQMTVEQLHSYEDICFFNHGGQPLKTETDNVDLNSLVINNTILPTTSTEKPRHGAEDIRALTGHIRIEGNTLRYGYYEINFDRWNRKINYVGSPEHRTSVALTKPIIEEIFAAAGFQDATVEIISFARGSIVVNFRLVTNGAYFYPHELEAVEEIVRQVMFALKELHKTDWPALSGIRVTGVEFMEQSDWFIFNMGLSNAGCWDMIIAAFFFSYRIPFWFSV